MVRKITLFGYGMAMTNSLLLLHTFIVAYLHGGKVLVNINSVGEANIELVMLLVFNAISLYAYAGIYVRRFFPKKKVVKEKSKLFISE